MKAEAEALFRRTYGGRPQWVGEAPGRINLIGEHVDYAGGFVLPCAVDRRIAVAGGRGPRWETHSEAGDGTAYVRAVGQLLGRPAQRAAIAANLPAGSGLSSSAALLVATAAGLDPGLSGEAAALLCQKAETAASGVRVGVMDQFASALGAAGHALLLNCGTLAYELVPFPDDLALAVLDSGIHRSLEGTPYNQRRAEAEAALAGRNLLDIEDWGDDPRLRHMVTETRRVLEFVDCLRAGDNHRLGELVSESHRSLRYDFEVSSPELDAVVSAAEAIPGCLGARMMGAGFGGSVLALVEARAAAPFMASIRVPVILCSPADGAFRA